MFVVSALWNALLTGMRLMPKKTVPKVLAESLGVVASLYVSMPLGCALYP